MKLTKIISKKPQNKITNSKFKNDFSSNSFKDFSSNTQENSPPKKKLSKIKLQSIEEQRNRMDEIYQKLNLKTNDDWFNIPRQKIYSNAGKQLLYYHYKGDLFKLLTTIYPNYSFSPFKIIQKFVNKRQRVILPSKLFFKSIKNQKKFMDNLFIKLNLNLIEDWLNISRKIIIKNGGKSLLDYYKRDFSLLLQTIYPNYPFDFKLLKFKSQNYFKSIENQKEFLDDLFIKFKLNSLEDWMNISQKKIYKNGGKVLLLKYNNNMKFLLTSIYPNYPWENSNFNLHYNLAPLIKEWIKKYQINQKKDWFRLAVDISFKFELFETLSLFYPSEKWKKSNFLIRNKKTTQRLLFSFTQMIYPSLLIFENYFHPKLIISNNNYELDIFIPAFTIGIGISR